MIRHTLATSFALFTVLGIGAERPKNPISAGAAVYVESPDGFDTYLIKALERKQVPLKPVGDKEKADYVISTSSEHSDRTTLVQSLGGVKKGNMDEAAVKVVDRKTGEIVFTDQIRKVNGLHGRQSAAEALANRLKKAVAGD